MGEDPDRIRREIEQTREELGDTVGALGYKADVKTRAKESLQDKRDSAKESVMGVKEKLVGGASDAAPDREQVQQRARQAKGLAQENPLGLAIGSLAVGFIAGLLALIALTAGLIAALDTGLPLWLAALIVMLLWGVVGAVLAARGRKELQQATPPVPQTVETVKEDIQWAKTQTGSAGK